MSDQILKSDTKLPEAWSSMYPYDHYDYRLNDGLMHYIDHGKGTPVIMVHGNPTWSFYYRDLVRRLSGNHRCLVPDHLGCGLSSMPAEGYAYRLEDRIRNLKEWIDGMGVDSFDLIVHDWGGAIGMGVATQWPERVRKVVVLNTAAFRSPRIPFRINLCRIPLLGRMLVCGLNGFAGPAVRMAVTKPLSTETKKAYLYPYRNFERREAVYRFVKDIPMKPTHPSYATLVEIENGLQKLKQHPMLIAWGGKDFCFNDHFYEGWRQRFPDAKALYFEDAGHYVLEDAREPVGDAVEAFVAP